MRKRLLGALTTLVLTGLLAGESFAGGGLSISFGIPFGRRRPDDGPRGYRREPYLGVRYRAGSSTRGEKPYERWDERPRGRWGERPHERWGDRPYYRPGLDIEYEYRWGSDRVVRREGAEARESTRDLIQALRFGSQGERERAAKELGRLPVDDVVGALTEALLRDPDKDVRKEAAQSLGNLGAEEARPALLHAARFDTSKRVREAAEKALTQLRPTVRLPAWQEYRYPERDYERFDREYREASAKLDRLLRELGSDDKDDREDAAKDLGKLEDRRAVPALVDVLHRDPEEDVRQEAAEALGRIKDRSALSALRWAERHDPEEDVREEAEKAIEKITD